MNQAIYYIHQSSVKQSGVKKIDTNQNGFKQNIFKQNNIEQENNEIKSDALNSIPEQAINISIGEVLDKQTLLTSLANACDFPSYFSHNWDAAWDCLTDSEIGHLKLDLTQVKNINTEDFNSFKRIIEDAYRDFGRPQLWIIVAEND